MRVLVRWISVLALAGVLLGGCDDNASTGGTGGTEVTGGTGGTGGVGGGPTLTCGPDAGCETEGRVCDINRGRCVECLTAANCMDDSKTCVDGSCQERLCIEDAECPPDMPECTEVGCAPCVGEVVTDGKEGDCYAARGPDGESPRKDRSDGCSAEAFVAALEDAGYDIPSDPDERGAIADNPVKRVTEGLCSVPFGNDGDAMSACELHDFCYAVCGSSRAQCDLEFAARMLETCRGTYISGPCLIACDAVAVIYATAIAAASDEAYLAAQQRNCDCCPGQTTNGVCEEDVGESIYNSRDCKGNFPDGTNCLSDVDCDSGHCSVHGECAPLLCITNGDCPSGICNWGVCLARTLEGGSGCSTSKACTSDACTLGVCLECKRDDQCVPSQHCNLLGNCVEDLGNNAACTANGECQSNICSAFFCAECVRDDQCPASEHCNLVGDCVDDLGNNAPCTANGEWLSSARSACGTANAWPASTATSSATVSTTSAPATPAPQTPNAYPEPASDSACSRAGASLRVEEWFLETACEQANGLLGTHVHMPSARPLYARRAGYSSISTSLDG